MKRLYSRGGGRHAVVVLVAVLTLTIAGAALPTINPTTTASSLATAIAIEPSIVTGASFASHPPAGTVVPNAVADSSSALGGFPTGGSTYAILTSGDALLADDPNDFEDSGVDLGGGNVRGNTDYDVTVLKIDLNVPTGRNCLTFDFRFLSDEFPEFVGSNFNDAFIAELDTSTWTTSGSDITAPNNFAFDSSGNVISINAAGAATMTAGHASGTTYDGATPLLSASTPITAGAHSLYLSIFDQGDGIYDSAVFIDSLVLGTTSAGGCQAGATVLSTTKTADSPTTVAGAQNGYTITIGNSSSSAVTLNSIFDVLPAGFGYVAGSTTGVTTNNPTVAGQTLTWAGPFNVPGNGSVSLHFNVVVSTTPGDYLNDAGGVVTGGSVAPTGPTAKITVTAPPSADLSVVKTDSPDPVLVGQELTYTLTVTNTGPDSAQGVTVTDTLPATVTLVSVSASQGSCTGTSTISCTLGTLANGASATVTIKVTPNNDTDLTNSASVSATTNDPNPANNSDSETTTVNPPNTPPLCAVATVDHPVLWPANHGLVLVTVTGVPDPDGDPVTITITSVTQDEPVANAFMPDAVAGPGPGQVWLRAERNGKGDGRVYRIAFTAADGRGGTCSGVVIVSVPHDQGRGPAVDSGGSYDSFARIP